MSILPCSRNSKFGIVWLRLAKRHQSCILSVVCVCVFSWLLSELGARANKMGLHVDHVENPLFLKGINFLDRLVSKSMSVLGVVFV